MGKQSRRMHPGVLADVGGRPLGFAEFGDRQGKPLFYFHGCPGSRLEGGLSQDLAMELGLRLICPDRPGYGLSPMRPERTIADWPADVSALARSLGLRSYGVLGVSGGGPYAAACAAFLPDEVEAAGLVCSLAPPDDIVSYRRMWPLVRLLFFLARSAPGATRIAVRPLGMVVSAIPEAALSLLAALAPAPDDRILADRRIRAVISESLHEALAQSTDGAVHDLMLYLRPWGMALESIRTPVLLWHGEMDVTVPVEMGRYMARTIPGCRACFHPGEGHISLAVSRMREILRAMARALGAS
jgi:pimeloyl-ACP methyl ester carboxylesterase